MRRFMAIVVLAATVCCAVSGCRKHKVIPDDTLAEIFHDAFLTNAYIATQQPQRDSTMIYEPIFARYGYTAEDVRYTIGNFSRRKSAKLSTVVDLARQRLEDEARVYDKEVMILDTITNNALRTFTRVVRRDTLIEVRKAADTTRLHIVLDDVRAGEYKVSYNYENGDDVQKYERVMRMWIERKDSTRRNSQMLRLRGADRIERSFPTDTASRRIVLNLGTQATGQRAPKPDFKIRNLLITYTLPAEQAIDSLVERFMHNSRVFSDDFFAKDKADSLALSAHSAGVR